MLKLENIVPVCGVFCFIGTAQSVEAGILLFTAAWIVVEGIHKACYLAVSKPLPLSMNYKPQQFWKYLIHLPRKWEKYCLYLKAVYCYSYVLARKDRDWEWTFSSDHVHEAISSVQSSHSVVSNSLWPHGLQHARPPCPSPTPRVYSNSCPLSWWCHPTISSSVVPFFSRLQSCPGSESFPMSQFFASGGQRIGVSASTSSFQ